MRRVLLVLGMTSVISALVVPAAVPAAGANRVASLQATIHTSAWSPPAPSAAGIAWWADAGTLVVVDSEVEEIVDGITYYQGVNTWEAATDGAVVRTSTTFPTFSSEPTDVAAFGDHVYFTDDGTDRIYMIDVGADGTLGTPDDTVAEYRTRSYNNQDPEALAADGTYLYTSDGVHNQVYRIDPGANGLFDETDDVVSCFDTRALGMRDPEGISVDPATGNVYIASRQDQQIAVATPAGELIDLISVSSVLPFGVAGTTVSPAGIALAPASDDPVRTDLYIADRGQDNDADPTENDGRVYEVRLDDPVTNLAPVVASPGRQGGMDGEVVRFLVVAADPNDDPLTYSITGTLPPGLTFDPATHVISGTIAPGAAVGGLLTTYTSSIRVSDGTLTSTRTLNWDVTLGTPNQPPALTSPGDQSNVAGDLVSLSVAGSDPDLGQALMFSATGLPPGLQMSCLTGQITGQIAPGAETGSPYTVHVTLADQLPGAQEWDSKWVDTTFTWTVAPNVPDFPPDPPTGLTITGDTAGLRLDWADNAEPDLAGYNVYRMVAGSPVKLNAALLVSSDYQDPDAPPGETSEYQVTAVDLAGQESTPTTGSGYRGPIALRAASSASGQNIRQLMVPRPAGLQPGDVMVAALAISGSATPSRTPLGWTLLEDHVSGTSLRQALYWKVATAVEPLTYRWDFPTKLAASATIVAYSGADATMPAIDLSDGLVNASSASITAPSLTATAADEVLVGFFSTAAGTQIVPDPAMVERAEARANGKKKNTLEAADQVLGAAGATGTRTATASVAAVNIGQVVILKPAP